MRSPKRDLITEGHPIGYSGARSEYHRPGVRIANFAEEVLARDFAGCPGCILDQRQAHFSGASTTQTDFAPHKVDAPSREDLALKYVKYGRSQALATDNITTFATVNQLAYEPIAQRGERKVQDLLWAGTKFVDMKVPLSAPPGAYSLAQERQRQWDEEMSADPYTTVEREQLAAVARSPNRISAKPPQCRPKAPGGQEAQVGRKAAGPCVEFFDKDFLRIGLRKGSKPASPASSAP